MVVLHCQCMTAPGLKRMLVHDLARAKHDLYRLNRYQAVSGKFQLSLLHIVSSISISFWVPNGHPLGTASCSSNHQLLYHTSTQQIFMTSRNAADFQTSTKHRQMARTLILASIDNCTNPFPRFSSSQGLKSQRLCFYGKVLLLGMRPHLLLKIFLLF